MVEKVNLLDLDQQGLIDFLASLGEQSYRATQLLKWIHYFGCIDFAAMTNLSKALRARLADCTAVHLPKIVMDKLSADGTRKWLLQLDCGNCIETVFIPEAGRGTLCVSSQVGCGLNCRFCSTATQGFNRNLSTAEIIGQVWIAVRQLSAQQNTHDRQVTNVVMMGMGEPLLNFEAVVTAMNIMLDDHAYGLSKRRVTLSTAGLVPQMQRLAQQSPVALAVSLHAPTDELRDVLVPINKKYPLELLMTVCRNYYQQEPKRRITFEYVMLAGVNDSLTQAKQLLRLLQGIPAKLNLIPFNPFPGTAYQTSKQSDILAFRDVIVNAGIATTVRKTRGDDIDAACGQLVGAFQDKTKRSQRWQQMVAEQRDVA